MANMQHYMMNNSFLLLGAFIFQFPHDSFLQHQLIFDGRPPAAASRSNWARKTCSEPDQENLEGFFVLRNAKAKAGVLQLRHSLC